VKRLPREELEALVTSAVRTARALHRLRGARCRVEDLTDVALKALCDALRTHDEAGAPLKYHVRRRVVGELLDAIASERKRGHREILVDDLSRPLPPGAEDDGDALARAAGLDARILDPEGNLLTHEGRELVRREVLALPKDERRLMELRHWQELPWKEVSRRLGVPVRTAQDHEAKIRVKLKAKLRAWYDGPPAA
jgi:RNA polymerase sigma factor (sigma-70 family)